MSLGQILVAVIVAGFFVYELVSLIRDIKKKNQAKKELQKEVNGSEKTKKA